MRTVQRVDENRKVPILIETLQRYVQKGQYELQIFHYFVCGVLAEGVFFPSIALRWISPVRIKFNFSCNAKDAELKEQGNQRNVF